MISAADPLRPGQAYPGQGVADESDEITQRWKAGLVRSTATRPGVAFVDTSIIPGPCEELKEHKCYVVNCLFLMIVRHLKSLALLDTGRVMENASTNRCTK